MRLHRTEANPSHCWAFPPLTVLHILQFYSSLSLLVLAADGRGSSWLSDELGRVSECYFFSPLVPPLVFPAMPRLFATHLPSGKPTFGDNKPENESGHVLTKLNQGKVENFFSSPLTILFLKATKREVEIIFNVFNQKRDEVIF